MRRVLFWMHLGAGVLASALILFFSVTGMLLAYERAIIHAADAHTYSPASAGAGRPRISLDTLLARAAAQIPQPLEALTIHPGAGAPLEVTTAQRDVYVLDPYSAEVRGPMSPRTRAFFAEVTALHRWFGLSSASHATAIAVKGATVLLFAFLLFSGTYLWLPRRWTWSALQGGVIPRLDAQGRARNYNLHKAAGFWTGLPLAVVVLTGIVMAYPWANALLFHLAGSPMPMRKGARPTQNRHPHEKQTLPAHLDEAFTRAVSGADSWRSASLRLTPGTRGLVFTVDDGDGGQPQKRGQLFIDSASLQVVRREPFSALSKGQRWRSWVRFVHTGEAGGWWGETLAAMTALGAAVLSLTGILLSKDRLERWLAQSRAKQASSSTGTMV